MTTDQLNTFRARLAHAITEIDRKEDERDRRARRRCNPYRLGIMLGAVERCCNDIAREGITPELAFADNFTPTADNHRAAVGLGLLLGVERGQWVALDAPTPV